MEQAFFNFKKQMPIKENIITCMTTMERSTRDRTAIACPIIATEFGNIYILDPQNFSVILQVFKRSPTHLDH